MTPHLAPMYRYTGNGRRFRVTEVRMMPLDVAPRDAGVVIIPAADFDSGHFVPLRVPPTSDDERGQAVLPVERDTSRLFTWLLGIVALVGLTTVAWAWLVAR